MIKSLTDDAQFVSSYDEELCTLAKKGLLNLMISIMSRWKDFYCFIFRAVSDAWTWCRNSCSRCPPISYHTDEHPHRWSRCLWGWPWETSWWRRWTTCCRRGRPARRRSQTRRARPRPECMWGTRTESTEVTRRLLENTELNQLREKEQFLH